MHRLTPLLLAVLVSACATAPGGHATFRQAARPAPSFVGPPPVMTPGYAPQTYQPAPYTPRGAGLPGERVRGEPGGQVPRSPNKRVVPPEPDGAPGLWAADGTQRASSPPVIANVYLPLLDVEGASDVNASMDECVARTNASMWKNADVRTRVKVLTDDERACLAAVLYNMCMDAAVRASKANDIMLIRRDSMPHHEHRQRARAEMQTRATHFYSTMCAEQRTKQVMDVWGLVNEAMK